VVSAAPLDRSDMAPYDTNLAAEFYVLACLHRLGMTANLTLGNKKGVDIVVAREAGDAVTVEVKGVAGRHDWPASNLRAAQGAKHFVVLVSFEGQIDNPEMPPPRVWVIPFEQVSRFMRQYTGRTNVMRAAVARDGGEFENAWQLIASHRRDT
jgi:hypothetical protein